MKAVVAERGQITIPKALRVALGIRPGTILDFEIRDHHLIAVKMEKIDPVEKVYGCLKTTLRTDEIIKDLRGKSDNCD
jgi:antitoxin PrlF